MKKRLGIFMFFNKLGNVEDYITYLLKDLNSELERLVIVCNGIINDEGKEKFKKFTSDIVVRPNIGFDVAAWQQVLIEYIGFEKVKEYDELVLLNDSFFGPIYPFKNIFENMENQEVDFWGMTAHGETDNVFGLCPYGYRPRYIQTYFMVIRKKMLISEEFKEFWVNLPVFDTFNELCEKFEAVFTKHFEDLGFKSGVYSDTADLESVDRRKNFSQHTFNLKELILNRNLPVIKRKFFLLDKATKLRYSDTSEINEILHFIKKNTNYDLSLVYDYLLKYYNITFLKQCFNWNYVLPTRISGCEEKLHKKTILVAHLYYENLFEYCLSYLKNLPEWIDLLITTDTEEKKIVLQNRINNRGKVILVNSRGRDISAFLVGSKKYLSEYEYIGFIHDKSSLNKEYLSVGRCFSDQLWNNILYSEEYIKNILCLFESHEKLGFVSPPSVYHGTYFASSANYWTCNYNKMKELLSRLGINVPLEESFEPFSIGSAFWCRYTALKPLLDENWEYTDFPREPLGCDGTISHAIERCFPYVAQSQGFYSGWVMTDIQAQAEIENYRYMFTQFYRAILRLPGVVPGTFFSCLNALRRLVSGINNQSIPLSKREAVKALTPKKILSVYRRVRYGKDTINK